MMTVNCIFEEYKETVEYYVKNDCREINFQNRVVLPLLETVVIDCTGLSVVDVHTQYKNKETTVHTRKHYAGDHTPDLLVARNWNYQNTDMPKKDYISVIEIKSPAMDPITSYSTHTREEVDEYVDICDRVIVTDCYVWDFYVSKKKTRFVLFDKNEWAVKDDKNRIVGWNAFIEFIKKYLKCKNAK